MTSLDGAVALVAGATRGAGRGIAVALGEAGATVYGTGRSTRGAPATPGRPETIEETAALVTEAGGHGHYARVDHTEPEQVASLIERIDEEQGRLDVLVNDVWGGDALTGWGKAFWEHSLEDGLLMLERAVHSHLITSRHAVPLMLRSESGPSLIVEITDGDHFGYRGNLYYDLVKTSVIRLAFAMAKELRKTRVTAVALTPGFLRSEAMLDNFGVTEESWRDAAKKEPDFIASETPRFVGRAVAALASDPEVASKAGRAFSSWGLSEEYGFEDADGRKPNWGRHFESAYGTPMPVCGDDFYAHWSPGPMEVVYPDWP